MVADAVSNVAGEMLTPMLQKANGQFSTSAQTGVGVADQIGVTFFPEAGSVNALIPADDMPSHIKFKPIGVTTPASWIETDPENPGFSEGELGGPFIIAGIAESVAAKASPTLFLCLSPSSFILVLISSVTKLT